MLGCTVSPPAYNIGVYCISSCIQHRGILHLVFHTMLGCTASPPAHSVGMHSISYTLTSTLSYRCVSCPLMLPASGVRAVWSQESWLKGRHSWVSSASSRSQEPVRSRAWLPPLPVGAWLCGDGSGRVNCFSILFPGFINTLLSNCLYTLTPFS